MNLIEHQLKNSSVAKTLNEIEHQLSSCLAQFEIVKGQLEPSSRRQLRDRFLQLAMNRSDSLASISILLADHAFKLPHRM